MLTASRFTVPTPRNAGETAFQARVNHRAMNLLSDGYRIARYGTTPAFAIFRPENKATTNGYRDYSVDLTPGKENCDCEAFGKNGYCKHVLAVVNMLAEDAAENAQIADYEKMLAGCECEVNGVTYLY